MSKILLKAARRGSAALGALLMVACHATLHNGSVTEGYVTTGASALWPDRTVPVCWEASPVALTPEADAAARADIEASVEAAYGDPTLGFQFTGWGDCTADADGVRIAVADSMPRVAGYGYWLNGLANGVTLNFSFALAGPASCVVSDAARAACRRTYAVHEFGHVLGLRHEANRPDTQCPAQDQTGGLGEAGAAPVGPFDADSVMSYCKLNADLAGGVEATLSGGDMQTLQAYYAREVATAGPDLGAGCAADAGLWDSIDNCCRLPASGWGGAVPVAYKACVLPSAAVQAQACGLAAGRWDGDRVCCLGGSTQPALPRWRTFVQLCL